MAATFLQDPAFKVDDPQRLAKTDLTQCYLMMNIGPSQLSYAVFDPHDQCFISLKGYYFDPGPSNPGLLEILEECFDHDKILFTGFSHTRISFDNPEFTLIPSDLYDPALKREYLTFLNPECPEQALYYDQINSQKAVNVYAIDKNVAGYLKKEFKTARYYHTESAFLFSLMKHEAHTGKRVFVRVLTGRITVTILEDGKLLLMQPYKIESGADALYYIMNSINTLRIPHQEAQVFLSGDIEEDSPLYLELTLEIPAVSWLKHPRVFNYVHAFREYPDHHFYNLISLGSCE